MADGTTGPPLNLTLPTVGGDIGSWGQLIIANFQAINAAFAKLGQLQVYSFVEAPDNVRTTFTSPVPLDLSGLKCLVLYNGEILSFGSATGFSLVDATHVLFTFAPNDTDDIKLVVIGTS